MKCGVTVTSKTACGRNADENDDGKDWYAYSSPNYRSFTLGIVRDELQCLAPSSLNRSHADHKAWCAFQNNERRVSSNFSSLSPEMRKLVKHRKSEAGSELVMKERMEKLERFKIRKAKSRMRQKERDSKQRMIAIENFECCDLIAEETEKKNFRQLRSMFNMCMTELKNKVDACVLHIVKLRRYCHYYYPEEYGLNILFWDPANVSHPFVMRNYIDDLQEQFRFFPKFLTLNSEMHPEPKVPCWERYSDAVKIEKYDMPINSVYWFYCNWQGVSAKVKDFRKRVMHELEEKFSLEQESDEEDCPCCPWNDCHFCEGAMRNFENKRIFDECFECEYPLFFGENTPEMRVFKTENGEHYFCSDYCYDCYLDDRAIHHNSDDDSDDSDDESDDSDDESDDSDDEPNDSEHKSTDESDDKSDKSEESDDKFYDDEDDSEDSDAESWNSELEAYLHEQALDAYDCYRSELKDELYRIELNQDENVLRKAADGTGRYINPYEFMDWCVHDMGISWTEAGKKWADAEPFIEIAEVNAEEALEDVDEVADVAESVEHSDAIHLAEQLEQGDSAGSSDTSILRYLRVLFAEEDQASNFLMRYPYLEIGFYDPSLTNMLMRNRDNNSSQQLLDEINQCRCCVRHQISRPTRIGSTPLICIRTNRTIEELDMFLEEWNCPCRHLARFIISDENGRVYLDR